jgi:hypothetical protein
MVARRTRLDGADAWRFDFDTGAKDYRQVKFWLAAKRDAGPSSSPARQRM